MDLSYRWLRSLAPGLTQSVEVLAERLAMYGAPVEEILPLGRQLRDLVVARVDSVRRHPNADRLSLCDVDPGNGRSLQVVCGATNVQPGGFYPFAPVGAMLPGGLAIKRAKIRGEVSEGMLCSEKELGLGREDEGIMELPEQSEPGRPLNEALELDDTRLILEITPNRGDLLSHIGVARELAPGGESGIRLPPFGIPAGESSLLDPLAFRRAGGEGECDGVHVRLEDSAACPRYMGAVIRGVRIAPSPTWLAGRLRAIGLRPINNVVDATNYVLHELGQPLHAFDLARLQGPEVVIRAARPGESIRTLDGENRELSAGVLVIADGTRPQAIAGVMGGEMSEVGGGTRDIFLECALFEPKSTRSTARAFGLSTDSSYRFERGIDREGMERAVRRAVALITAVAGGDPIEALDLDPEPARAPVIPLRPARVTRVLGADFDAGAIRSHLEPLGFRIVAESADGLRIRVPGHRWADVEREVDLIEEVARRQGYDSFPADVRPFRPSAVPDDELAALEDRLRTTLVGRGFLECRTAAFVPAAEGDIELLNPLSAAESRLRRDLLPGLLHRVEYNFARGARHVRLFEIGTVFRPAAVREEPPREATRLAAVMTGARTPPHWTHSEAPFDAWDLKALLQDVAAVVGLAPDSVEPAETAFGSVLEAEGAPDAADLRPAAVAPDSRTNVPSSAAWELLAPGLRFRVVAPAGEPLGAGGQVRPGRIDAPAWAGDVWGLEIELRTEAAAPEPRAFRSIPTHPGTERDLALLVPDSIWAARVSALIREAGGHLLESVTVFDLFRGADVPSDHRSIGFRLRLRAPDRTITDAEADSAVVRILDRLREELGVERRG